MTQQETTQLEHELAAALKKVDEQRELLRLCKEENEEKRKDIVWTMGERAKLIDRIKRLEKTLDLIVPHCSWVHHSKKHQHEFGEPCPVVALIENAKEDKL